MPRSGRSIRVRTGRRRVRGGLAGARGGGAGPGARLRGVGPAARGPGRGCGVGRSTGPAGRSTAGGRRRPWCQRRPWCPRRRQRRRSPAGRSPARPTSAPACTGGVHFGACGSPSVRATAARGTGVAPTARLAASLHSRCAIRRRTCACGEACGALSITSPPNEHPACTRVVSAASSTTAPPPAGAGEGSPSCRGTIGPMAGHPAPRSRRRRVPWTTCRS
jgi:hypothetical protein